MNAKNTSASMLSAREHIGALLGDELSTLLQLLNGQSDAQIKAIAGGVSASEMRLREAYLIHKGSQRPNWLCGAAQVYPVFKTEEGIAKLRAVLRRMVDAWINTGDTSDGTHQPRVRSLARIPNDPNWRERQTERSGSIEDSPIEFVFEQYGVWRPNARFVEDEGNAEWNETPRRRRISEVKHILAPHSQAFEIVNQLFRSDGRFHIGKCMVCSAYFYRQRTSPLRRGSYCGVKCQNRASSTVSKKLKREKTSACRFSLAVEEAVKLMKRDGEKAYLANTDKKAIERAVNGGWGKRSREPNSISQLWVSRNEEEIIKRARNQLYKSSGTKRGGRA